MSDESYFQQIERHFIRLRGAPLLLSPVDFQVAESWRSAGIPLELVLRVLDEIFDARPAEADPVQSLRYCASRVEAAWRAERDVRRAGEREQAPPLDVGERLRVLAAALPDDLAGVEQARNEIRQLEGSVEELEARLAEIDTRLVRQGLERLSEEERQGLERHSEQALEALSARMPEKERRKTLRRMVERGVRRATGLPVLSLFHDA